MFLCCHGLYGSFHSLVFISCLCNHLLVLLHVGTCPHNVAKMRQKSATIVAAFCLSELLPAAGSRRHSRRTRVKDSPSRPGEFQESPPAWQIVFFSIRTPRNNGQNQRKLNQRFFFEIEFLIDVFLSPPPPPISCSGSKRISQEFWHSSKLAFTHNTIDSLYVNELAFRGKREEFQGGGAPPTARSACGVFYWHRSETAPLLGYATWLRPAIAKPHLKNIDKNIASIQISKNELC